MNDLILQICHYLEQKHSITILTAVENGSRAWRMSSKSSDYDIRFIFKRPLEEYIQIEKPPEVISAFFDMNGTPCPRQEALFDMNGFDIFKYVGLLRKSNPTVIEWIVSDMLYFGEQNPVFKHFALTQFNPLRVYHAYKSLCRNNYTKFIKSGKQVTQKIYLYVFRGLINAKWVAVRQTIPPIIFLDTINGLKEQIPAPIRKTLQELIHLRSQGQEQEPIQPISELNDYVEAFLTDDSEAPPARKHSVLTELNAELRRIVLS